MTGDDNPSALAPVLQLFAVLVPTVANAFLLVYVLLGLVLEGPQRARWTAESLQVALYTGTAVVLFCSAVIAVLRAGGRDSRYPLVIATLAQIILALLLVLAVVVLRII